MAFAVTGSSSTTRMCSPPSLPFGKGGRAFPHSGQISQIDVPAGSIPIAICCNETDGGDLFYLDPLAFSEIRNTAPGCRGEK